jgi:uncharacterized protein YndB with AHSA1/START domain
MSNQDEKRSVVVERVFPHPREKVWRALTESPLLAQWLMKNDFEPKVGRKFQFRAEPVPGWSGLVDCEVKVINPLKELLYSWETMGHMSTVLWTLTPTERGTHLRKEHGSFGPDQEAAYKGATYGWRSFLDQLEKLLEGDEL